MEVWGRTSEVQSDDLCKCVGTLLLYSQDRREGREDGGSGGVFLKVKTVVSGLNMCTLVLLHTGNNSISPFFVGEHDSKCKFLEIFTHKNVFRFLEARRRKCYRFLCPTGHTRIRIFYKNS
jgi:hypothetical protein